MSQQVLRLDSRVSRTKFIGVDSRGRSYQVESDGDYRLGQTVLVKDSVIIAKGRGQKYPKQIAV